MMERVRVLIVEDEFLIAISIKAALQSINIKDIEIATSYQKSIDFLKTKQYDLVLLDINLNEKKTGIDIANLLNEKYNIPFIYLSASYNPKIVSEVAATNPSTYIIKPFREEDLICNVEIALRKQIEKIDLTQKITIKEEGAIVSIKEKDIIVLKAMDNYTIIYLKNEKHITKMFLKDVAQKLGPKFLRVHRSYVVSLRYVETFIENKVYVEGMEIPVSASRKKELTERLLSS